MAKDQNWFVIAFFICISMFCTGCLEDNDLRPVEIAYLESDLLERVITFSTTSIANDFSKSSDSTKIQLLPKLQETLSTIMWSNYVSGWSMISLRGENIFMFGKTSTLIVSAEICTINGILNLYSGYCAGDFIVYIDEQRLRLKLGNIPINCSDCNYTLFSSKRDSTINIISNINLKCPLCKRNPSHQERYQRY